MNKAKKVAASTRKFVSDHKVGIAVVSTAYVCYKIHRGTVKGWNEFLTEKGLFDEFYTVED